MQGRNNNQLRLLARRPFPTFHFAWQIGIEQFHAIRIRKRKGTKRKKILDDHYWIAARNRIENASFAKKLIPYEAIKLVLE